LGKEELLELDIDLVEPNSQQPRSRFDEEHLEELAQSIKENGIVQPILVRRRGAKYQLVAGERRWRAAQRAGLQKVPAVIREIPDEKMLELALIENIQRQELNPIEEAHAYKSLIETLGLTQETVAQRVGRDRSFITNHLRLLRMPEDLQRMVEEGKLSVGHARAILGLDDNDSQKKVARMVLEQQLSVRETERAVKRVLSGVSPSKAAVPAPKKNDANVRAAESKLRRKLGTQVKIIQTANMLGGRIEIEYYSQGDLDRLYRIIMSATENAPETET
jgi:ParB family transcriptional regulator, chromosome partitioning protein